MRPCFQLKIPARFIHVEVVVEGALDILGPRIVAFDQVRVIAVHDPHEIGERGSGAGVKPGAEPGRQHRDFGDQVKELAARVFQQAGLDPAWGFDQWLGHNLPILHQSQPSGK